jgi:hypothetical protein
MPSRVAAVASLVAALALAPSAFACGTGGYSYAGLAASRHAYGIRASVTPLASFPLAAGHIAGWVGVGGPHQGPGGADEWLQVGVNSIGGIGGSNVYYEVTRAGAEPTYHQVKANVPVGKPAQVAVLEVRARANWWRVWVNGSPVSDPIHLPSSHGRWAPIATAESWDGGAGGACNEFLFRFHGVAVAQAPGGSWAPLTNGYSLGSAALKLHRSRTSASFVAAQGADALRSLASVSP